MSPAIIFALIFAFSEEANTFQLLRGWRGVDVPQDKLLMTGTHDLADEKLQVTWKLKKNVFES